MEAPDLLQVLKRKIHLQNWENRIGDSPIPFVYPVSEQIQIVGRSKRRAKKKAFPENCISVQLIDPSDNQN